MLYMVTFTYIYHQYTPNVSINIPAPWIRHGLCNIGIEPNGDISCFYQRETGDFFL